MTFEIDTLITEVEAIRRTQRVGKVSAILSNFVEISGLSKTARVGDLVCVDAAERGHMHGEIVSLSGDRIRVMLFEACDGLGLGADVRLVPSGTIRPCDGWVGRVIDAFGAPLDDAPLPKGSHDVALRASPPLATHRKALGARLHTGLSVIDTMLPVVRGQRMGIFAGSGVGKSSLIADLARTMEADVVVLALVGERGREIRHFLDDVLGAEGIARSVTVAATSDMSPLIKRRAAWTAMATAEFFRDRGKQVLLLVDSITRFAEAHREVALTAGEPASLRAFPPSTSGMISALAERAGPGVKGSGDITALFSVLVAGSDMDEPIADITRGVLDGHIILSRDIAERGRFPAIDVRRSVSRSLPAAANAQQNNLIKQTREVLGVYENAEAMIQTGLYTSGTDPRIDHASRVWSHLNSFFEERHLSFDAAFGGLSSALNEGETGSGAST